MENRNLFLSEEVNEKSVKNLIEKIIWYDQYDSEQENEKKNYERTPIKLYINTVGGSVYDGFGLINIIENSKTPVHTYCVGQAMSMGVPIMVAGHRRFAYKYSTFMIHDISGGVRGTTEYMKRYVQATEKLKSMYFEYIMQKTKIKQNRLNEVSDRLIDWFISANEALEIGIIDEIL